MQRRHLVAELVVLAIKVAEPRAQEAFAHMARSVTEYPVHHTLLPFITPVVTPDTEVHASNPVLRVSAQGSDADRARRAISLHGEPIPRVRTHEPRLSRPGDGHRSVHDPVASRPAELTRLLSAASRTRVRLLRRTGRTDPRRAPRAIARPRDPSGLDRRVDLLARAGTPAGDGNGRRRASAIPLPPGVAPPARPREVRAHREFRRGVRTLARSDRRRSSSARLPSRTCARVRGSALGPRSLPGRWGGLCGQRLLRLGHPPARARRGAGGRGGRVRLRREGRQAPYPRDPRSGRGAGPEGAPATAWSRRVARLEGRRRMA